MDRKFVCSFCGVSFPNNSNLTVHIKTRHTHEKPFKCGNSGIAFIHATDLQSHRLTHAGEHPFKCMFWEISFLRLNPRKRTHKD